MNQPAASTFRRSRSILAGLLSAIILVAPTAAVADSPESQAPDESCRIPDGPLARSNVPEGTSAVRCGLVGRVIRDRGEVGLTVPEPGTSVATEALKANGPAEHFSIEVRADGAIRYPERDDAAQANNQVALSASPGECVDQTYATTCWKEYDTYNWYIGDRGMPAGLSRSAAQTAFADAINNITGSTNNCSYSDQVSAQSSYKGTTTYEADMNSAGDCTDRDEKSTWDAGNLPSSTVAQTCTYYVSLPGAKDDSVEADVRYNTTDKSFTNSPTSSCSGLYDVRSLGTHEAGHVFGLADLYGDDAELTMYGFGTLCSTKQRTLGVGDVLGLRSIY